MKTIFAAFLLMIVVATSLTAFAQNSNQTIDRPFDFKVSSDCVGCVSFGDFTANFSLLTQGYPAKVRFYYSSWYADPDDTSEYFELPIEIDASGNVLIPAVTFGNFTSASRRSFAYGLVSGDGNLLWFMHEEERDPDRHSVDVQ